MAKLITHVEGGYTFVPSSATYSLGVQALQGYMIVHTTLRQPLPYVAGFDSISRQLASLGRPLAALCAVELRVGVPFATVDDFNAFNLRYAAQLKTRDLHVANYSPIARTNVAPLYGAPVEPSIYAFAYTVPDSQATRTSFVMAGCGEIGGDTAESIVRRGESTPDALREKAAFVVQQLDSALARSGLTWTDTTGVNVYTTHSLHPMLDIITHPIGAHAIHGVHLFPSRPPIVDLEFEMDLRGVAREEFA